VNISKAVADTAKVTSND